MQTNKSLISNCVATLNGNAVYNFSNKKNNCFSKKQFKNTNNGKFHKIKQKENICQ